MCMGNSRVRKTRRLRFWTPGLKIETWTPGSCPNARLVLLQPRSQRNFFQEPARTAPPRGRQSIPFDSKPRILRGPGCTITILRLISFSARSIGDAPESAAFLA